MDANGVPTSRPWVERSCGLDTRGWAENSGDRDIRHAEKGKPVLVNSISIEKVWSGCPREPDRNVYSLQRREHGSANEAALFIVIGCEGDILII